MKKKIQMWWTELQPIYEFPDDGQTQTKVYFQKKKSRRLGMIDFYYAVVNYSDDGYTNSVVILKNGEAVEISEEELANRKNTNIN